jgi:hypothetical protein
MYDDASEHLTLAAYIASGKGDHMSTPPRGLQPLLADLAENSVNGLSFVVASNHKAIYEQLLEHGATSQPHTNRDYVKLRLVVDGLPIYVSFAAERLAA